MSDTHSVEIDIVHIPRSEWPKSVLETFAKAKADRERHTIQLCCDATLLGEGCPIQNCRCFCHQLPTGASA